MKSSKAKKIILLLLVSIAAYIWWGNIKSFSNKSSGYYNIQDIDKNHKKDMTSKKSIQYIKPRINPFKRTINTEQPPEKKSKPKKLPKPPAKLSSKYKLSGFIQENKTSQAIITFSTNITKVLSIKDSLEQWEFIEIKNNLAIFRHEKIYDTLWMDKKIY